MGSSAVQGPHTQAEQALPERGDRPTGGPELPFRLKDTSVARVVRASDLHPTYVGSSLPEAARRHPSPDRALGSATSSACATW